MAEAIIDKVEVVKVNKHHGNEVCRTFGINDGLNNPVLQKIPVGQAGKSVVIRLMFQRFLVMFRIRYVILHADEMSDSIRLIAYWRDAEFIPEQASILAIITQYRLAFALSLDGSPYYFKPRLSYVFAVQKARIQPENIFPRITGYAFERGIHVNDRIIRLMAARNQETVDARFNGTVPQTDSLIRTLDHRLFFCHQQIQQPCGRNHNEPAGQRINPGIALRFDTGNKYKRHSALQRYPQTEDNRVNPGDPFHLPPFYRGQVFIRTLIHTFLPDQDIAK